MRSASGLNLAFAQSQLAQFHFAPRPLPLRPIRSRFTTSTLSYYDEEGAGTENGKKFHYRQAVVIGNIVKCSGQGGWTNDNQLDANDPLRQVDLAFENVDRVLRTVGPRGWEDVYLLRSHHVDMAVTYPYVVEKLKQRIPEHRPIWTALSVPRLAFPPMQIELEVEAYIPDKK